MRTSTPELNIIRAACRSEGQLQFMFKVFAEHSEHSQANPFQLLTNSIDDSPYGLREWLDAIEFMYQWLESEGRTASFAVVLGYLDCCIQAMSGDSTLPDFDWLVTEMLQQHGFDG